MNDAEQADSQQELGVLFARKRPKLVRIAQRIVTDEYEAEDIVQETMAATLRRIKVAPPRRLAAYVFRAVEMNALKALARRRVAVSLDEARHPASGGIQDEAEEPEIDPVTLERALMQLPPAQHVVIRMKYYLGYTFRQVGEVLSISVNTAASRCRYALAAMRKQILGETHRRSSSDGKE